MGQLFVVAISFVMCRALLRRLQLDAARTAALYAIGGVAAYWSFTRIAATLL